MYTSLGGIKLAIQAPSLIHSISADCSVLMVNNTRQTIRMCSYSDDISALNASIVS